MHKRSTLKWLIYSSAMLASAGMPMILSRIANPAVSIDRRKHLRPPGALKNDNAFVASCIGCGACVAACPNASAMLFVAAKVSQLSLLPQGQVEAKERVAGMVDQMDKEGFGNCSNEYECEAACPKEISVANIARMNREYRSSQISS